LQEEYGAPKLAHLIIRAHVPKPRNVTATMQERAAIFALAAPHLRCFLMMCSDMAIRSGTAAKLGPEHYDSEAGTLTFRTKYQNAQRLPVTQELREMLDTCKEQGVPFIAQLPRGVHWRSGRPMPGLGRIKRDAMYSSFDTVKRKLGITRSLTPHDLRRTTARRVYDLTKDLRLVQALLGHSDLGSTVWYLQDNTTELSAPMLELAKLNPHAELTEFAKLENITEVTQ